MEFKLKHLKEQTDWLKSISEPHIVNQRHERFIILKEDVNAFKSTMTDDGEFDHVLTELTIPKGAMVFMNAWGGYNADSAYRSVFSEEEQRWVAARRYSLAGRRVMRADRAIVGKQYRHTFDFADTYRKNFIPHRTRNKPAWFEFDHNKVIMPDDMYTKLMQNPISQSASLWDPSFKYIEGELVVPTEPFSLEYKDNVPGIHFFLNMTDALAFFYNPSKMKLSYGQSIDISKKYAVKKDDE